MCIRDRPIVVGGTGLYIKALVDGFSEIPEIDPKVRAKSRAVSYTHLTLPTSDLV